MDQANDLSTSMYLLMAGVVGMLLLAMAIIFFFVIYQRRLLNQQNQIRQLEIDYQKDLLKFTIAAQEAERKRIANDLHDGIGSLLSTAKLYFKQLKFKDVNVDQELIKTEAGNLLDEAISNVRAISRDLLPKSLEQLGFIAAVNDLCRRIEGLNVLQVDFQFNANQRFAKEQEVVLYRIMQELINNTLKHAKAGKIDIQLITKGDSLQLMYKDDGQGFDYESWKQSKISEQGLGMKSIESRVNMIGGRLEFQSQKNKGIYTKIVVENL